MTLRISTMGMGLISIGLALGGCGHKKKKKSHPMDKPFLLDGQMEPSEKINPTIGANTLARLSGLAGEFQVPKNLFLQSGDVSIPIEYSEDYKYCLDNALEEGLEVEIEEDTIKIYGSVNLSACFQEHDIVADQNIHDWSGTVDMYKEYRCDGVDWNEAPEDNLFKLEPQDLGNYCAASSEIDILVNIREHVNKKYSTQASSVGSSLETVADEYEASFTIADSEGEVCTFTRDGAAISVGDCVEQGRDRKLANKYWIDGNKTYSKSDLLPGFEDYVRIEMKDLEGRTDETWFESGTFDVWVNDWKGSLATLPDATAPEYELERGRETIKGVLTPAAPSAHKRIGKFFVKLFE
jgi:hypothetical protein